MMRIAINAGHFPGLDSGAVGQSRLCEANVVKNIATFVVSILQSVGYNALFIQDNELYNICDLSNDFNADLFVSIHCNGAENEEARGTETFYYDGNEAGLNLAKCVQKQVVDALTITDRGVKDGSWLYVVKHTNAPAILVETAFISNTEDEELLTNKQEEFARAIARGITDYVG